MKEGLDPRQIGELLGLFAHDLRNPLSALHSNAGFLDGTPDLDEDSREAIADLAVACDGLGHIIDNLDLFAQALRGGSASSPARTLLVPLVSESVERARRVAASHGVSIQLEPGVGGNGSGESPSVRVVAEFFQRALGNLLRNSVQHAPAGTTVRVSVLVEGERALVQVADDGTAIPAEHAGEAFTARGQSSLKVSGAGRYSRGLGLYAASIAAAAAGVEIGVCNGAAGGACFRLLVPLAAPGT